MQLALPELRAPQEDFNRIYYNENATALEVQVAASVLKNERRKAFKHYETSNLKCITSFAGAPFIMYGLYHVSALCASPVLDIGSQSFLWCPALTLPDPYFVLPLTFCALTLANFELSLPKDIKKGWMKNVVWAARMGCLCVVPVASSFRSGVCLYFVGMSLIGLLQPILLRLPAFRRLLKFPEPGARAKEEVRTSDDPLQTSLTVQFPYLSHLLRPETEENEMLFRRAAAKPSPRAAAVRTSAGGPVLTRYAPGKNPLMQEIPIRRESADGTAKAMPKKERAGERKSTSSKGLNFASGNWKMQQETFAESDFIPEEGKHTPRGKP
ncbi:hypothetical protein STCU_00488 [Strigomonas culicis]|uniref:Preprotein translocase subunit YidC n=1 Tax=Strigomonas culicis TaxID=28005 RepID=S9V6E1_9TRYP|nr:hypothetical protein STCU_00488 [Strigomonas culicis]|eukprot:EPY36624.1 hypothetical protein STCU_00488 [Strigomonas culicis]